MDCRHASSTASPDVNAASSTVAADPDATVIPAVDVSLDVDAVGNYSNSAVNAAAPSFEAVQANVASSAIAADVSPHLVAVGNSVNNASDSAAPLNNVCYSRSSTTRLDCSCFCSYCWRFT